MSETDRGVERDEMFGKRHLFAARMICQGADLAGGAVGPDDVHGVASMETCDATRRIGHTLSRGIAITCRIKLHRRGV
jgi:hypothetical protein